MGACTFITKKVGIFKTPMEAFLEAVEDAQYEYGHGGDTGTIAEKDGFTMVELPPRKNIDKFLQEMLDDSEGFWHSKYDNCACIELKGVQLQNMRGRIYKGKRNFRVYYFIGTARE